MNVEPFTHVMAVVVTMRVNLAFFGSRGFYLFAPFLRLKIKKSPVETPAVAITPITPAAPVERR